MAIPSVPTIFNKFPQTVIATGDNVVLPKNSEKPDYEAEFAFVIGKGGRHIPADKWQEHVFGYTIVNDVSARDVQLATTQWLMGKTFDTFCPMGPAIVTADEIADPHALNIKLTIGDEVLQNSNTRELIFRIPELIAFLSSVCTLEPGDVVSTGTPSGVGFARKPPRYLRAGDTVVHGWRDARDGQPREANRAGQRGAAVDACDLPPTRCAGSAALRRAGGHRGMPRRHCRRARAPAVARVQKALSPVSVRPMVSW